MTRSTLAFALAAASGLAACAGPPPPSITVYEAENFAGARAQLREGYSDLDDQFPDIDDEISSFQIERGVWQVCRSPGYRDCRTTDRSMADLGEWDFDNAISSLRPVDVVDRDDVDFDEEVDFDEDRRRIEVDEDDDVDVEIDVDD
jgi:hypothetical protein